MVTASAQVGEGWGDLPDRIGRERVVCAHCGVEFTTPARHVRRGYGRFCSRACSSRFNGALSRLATEAKLRAEFEDVWSIPEPNSGCWLWLGPSMSRGYGSVYDPATKRRTGAHRMAWRLYRGAIPDGLHVLHRCDVPWCVNPDHLFLGTHAENMADMRTKRRQATGARITAKRTHHRGEAHHSAKLTEDAVRSIRARVAAGEKHAAIAADHDVHPHHISLIIRKEVWAHV